MGISGGEKEPEQTLIFVSEEEDEFLGKHGVFKMEEEPYTYFLRVERPLLASPEMSQEEIELLTQLAGTEHRAVAKLQSVKKEQDKQLCSQSSKLITYEHYYNFSLRSAILRKRTLGQTFRATQVWYLIETLFDLAKFFKEKAIYYGNYNLDTLFLSPQGLLKVYLHDLMPNCQHHGYFRAQSGLRHSCLAPQVIEQVPRLGQQPGFDKQKADVFSISISVLCAVHMCQQSAFYRQGRLLESQLTRHIKSLALKFDDKLQIFMTYALEFDPRRRVSIQQALNFVKNIKEKGTQVQGFIRLKVEDTERRVGPPSESKRLSVRESRAVPIRPVQL